MYCGLMRIKVTVGDHIRCEISYVVLIEMISSVLLQIWTMREYHSPDPIILSVGEDEEVSIADVARHVAGKQLTTVVYCTVLYFTVLYCTVLYFTSLYFFLIIGSN